MACKVGAFDCDWGEQEEEEEEEVNKMFYHAIVTIGKGGESSGLGARASTIAIDNFTAINKL